MTCYIMDTDHLSLYERAHPKICNRILQVRQHSSDTLFTTVVSLEEQYALVSLKFVKPLHLKHWLWHMRN